MSMGLRLLLCGIVCLLASCGGRQVVQPAPGEDAYPTRLREPASIGPDFAMQQEVTMSHAQGENTFRAVLQKQGDTLVLLGLAPHGGRAFVLTQTGTEVEFESFMPGELPFPPQYILHDVHRTWFVNAPEGTVELDGERVTTRMENGRVVERLFERLDGRPEGTLRVTYEGGLQSSAPAGAEPPSTAVLHNGWFGYTATVRTLQWQTL